MGRTLTEQYLGDPFQIVMFRTRDAEGVLQWAMRVTYQTHDADFPDDPMFAEARDDVLDLLTAQQRTNAIAFATTILARVGTLLQVATEKP